MAQAAVVRPRGAGRAQLLETALRLFAVHGVEGTSLQTIADEAGVTKAAVYYHFKAKDEIVFGVLAPIFDELPAVIERVRARRGRQARVDDLVAGVVDVVLTHHARYCVLVGDPSATRLLAERKPGMLAWNNEIIELIWGPDPDPFLCTAVAVFGGGVAAAVAGENPPELRENLIECGRRLLHGRRKPAPEPAL